MSEVMIGLEIACTRKRPSVFILTLILVVIRLVFPLWLVDLLR